MTASGHKKFLFDTDFSPESELRAQLDAVAAKEKAAKAAAEAEAEAAQVAEHAAPTYGEEDLAQAREEGYQSGHTTATQDLTTALEQRVANTLDAINTQVAALAAAFDADKEERSRDAVAVATVIVRKLFPALNMDKSLDEIKHMILEAMQRTSGAPSLIVRVHPDMHQTIEDQANQLASQRGHEGTLTVMADDSVAEGDAAVEWDGGGMIRDSKVMWQEIDEIIERNLGSKRANGQDAATAAPQSTAEEPQMVENPALEGGQEVVNDAPVGENEQAASESPLTTQEAEAGAPSEQPDDVAPADDPQREAHTEDRED